MRAELSELKDRIERLEHSIAGMPRCVAVQSLPDSALELTRAITVSLEVQDGEVVATFPEGGIAATGSDDADAIWNLSELILERFLLLRDLPEKGLGLAMRRQARLLCGLIREARWSPWPSWLQSMRGESRKH